MRDTNDMMEDAICEDTMMECSGDGGGLEDLVNLASDIADSAPSIRDAAERLLTLLGVDDDDDVSSSEDEGVEVDLDDSDIDEPQDTRLLHQLAVSLAQELKYAKQNSSNLKLAQSQNGTDIGHGKDSVQMSMDFASELASPKTMENNFDGFYQSENIDHESTYSQLHHHNPRYSSQHRSLHPQGQNHHQLLPPPPPYESKFNSQLQSNNQSSVQVEKTFGTFGIIPPSFQPNTYSTHLDDENKTETMTSSYITSFNGTFAPSNSRSRIGKFEGEETRSTDEVSWGIGWDACASEALRYLVEDEGLPPHHPTVIAMKNHLDMQRARVLS